MNNRLSLQHDQSRSIMQGSSAEAITPHQELIRWLAYVAVQLVLAIHTDQLSVLYTFCQDLLVTQMCITHFALTLTPTPNIQYYSSLSQLLLQASSSRHTAQNSVSFFLITIYVCLFKYLQLQVMHWDVHRKVSIQFKVDITNCEQCLLFTFCILQTPANVKTFLCKRIIYTVR